MYLLAHEDIRNVESLKEKKSHDCETFSKLINPIYYSVAFLLERTWKKQKHTSNLASMKMRLKIT